MSCVRLNNLLGCNHDMMAKTAAIRLENPPKTPARDRTFDGPVRER